jgi:hypothetical protein
MDPNTGGHAEFDELGDGTGKRPESAASEPAPSGQEDGTVSLPRAQRPPRDALAAPEASTGGGTAAKVAEVVAGDCLLTVNPVDGSEIAALPPDRLPGPVRRSLEDRAARQDAARPPRPPGPDLPALSLLEREEERERLARLLSRGRSVRLTGPSGVGRSVLLDAVAAACAGLAPDGVVRLSGYRRTPGDLLQELFTSVYDAEDQRPDRPRLLESLSKVGAIVVVDDLEFGGTPLEEVLAAAPECAFLLSVTPDVPAPSGDSLVEEIFLPGLTRVACLELLEQAVERPLLEDEEAWAADLWFESEGLPLRFVQAGALLRQRDALGVEAMEGDDPVWDMRDEEDAPVDAPFDTIGSPVPGANVPLPSLGESAAPAELLASRLSDAGRDALRFAVALGGEVPHQAHLPALVGDTHGDAALGELVAAGLAVPVAGHYRLATGVRKQLADGPFGDDAASQAHAAAQHYAWWVGHPSVTPERVAAEAEAIIAAMAACRDGGHTSTAVLLARTAAPVFAAALHWSAWERALRIGQEAARQAGEVAEEAYFHHELGILAVCTGNLDRARTELEASIGLRGALADRQGSTVGRRALALIADRSRLTASTVTPVAVEEVVGGTDASAFPADRVTTVISKRLTVPVPLAGARRAVLTGPRRNLAAAGAGVLLAAVLGTIVTLGATTGHDANRNTPLNVKPGESADPGPGGNGLPAAGASTPGETRRPSPTTSGTSTGAVVSPSGTASGTVTPTGGGSTPTDPGKTTPAKPGTPTRPTTPTPTPTKSPSPSPSSSSPSPSATDTTSSSTSPNPPPAGTSNSASAPVQSSSGPGTPSEADSASGAVV